MASEDRDTRACITRLLGRMNRLDKRQAALEQQLTAHAQTLERFMGLEERTHKHFDESIGELKRDIKADFKEVHGRITDLLKMGIKFIYPLAGSIILLLLGLIGTILWQDLPWK